MTPGPTDDSPPHPPRDVARAVLAYHAPSDGQARPSPLTAALLALPGAACWCVFVGALVARPVFGVALFRLVPIPPVPLLLLLWAVAIVTAVASVVYYARRRPRPWYVVLCLAINGCGLLFTVAVVSLLVIAVARRGVD